MVRARMRILRRQSNLEVSYQGLAFFVIGMILATFFGGAARTLLHSEIVQRRILQALKEQLPKQEIQVDNAEILLARGIWPGLAMRVKGLTIKQEVCGKLSFVLSLPETVLPVRWLSVIRRPLRLATVEIIGGELKLDYRDCKDKNERPEERAAESSGAVMSAPSQSWNDHSLAMPKLKWEKVSAFLRGADIKDFTITYEKNPTWKVSIKNASLDVNHDLEVHAAVDVQKSLPFGALTHPMTLDIQADDNDHLNVELSAEFKEGRVKFRGDANTHDQVAKAKVELRQVPIKDFMNEMSQIGVTTYDLKLKSTWLSCGLEWEGSLAKPTAKPVQISNCQIEGGYGHVALETAEIWLDGSEYFRKPAEVKVMQLQVQPILEALNRKILPAVLSQLGQWSGKVVFESRRNWWIDGELQNAEIVFANQSSRGKQLVSKIRTSVKHRGTTSSVKLDSILLRDGEMLGVVEGELDEELRNGNFQIQISSFSVAPQIQTLLVGGSVDPIRAEGMGTLTDGELSHWTGLFSLMNIKGEGWKARDLMIRTRFQSGTFKVSGQAKQASVDGNWRHYPELRRVLKDLPAELNWNDMSAVFDVQKTGGVLQSFTARQIGGPEWRTTGTWVRDGLFRGRLALGGGKAGQYSLRGENGKLAVELQ